MEKLFTAAMKECTIVMEDHLKQAKERGKEFQLKLLDEQKIKVYQKNIDMLLRHRLFPSA